MKIVVSIKVLVIYENVEEKSIFCFSTIKEIQQLTLEKSNAKQRAIEWGKTKTINLFCFASFIPWFVCFRLFILFLSSLCCYSFNVSVSFS